MLYGSPGLPQGLPELVEVGAPPHSAPDGLLGRVLVRLGRQLHSGRGVFATGTCNVAGGLTTPRGAGHVVGVSTPERESMLN